MYGFQTVERHGVRRITMLVVALAMFAAACGGTETTDTTAAAGATEAPDAGETTAAPDGAETTAAPDGTEAPDTTAGTDESAEPVTVQFSFDWKPDGDWAPVIWADDQGYFEEEGLEVEWVEGDGSSAVLPLLGEGTIDIAQVSAPPLVLSVPEGIPVTVVGVLQTESSNVFICDPSIQTPQDIEGKTYADQVGEFEHGLWLAWTNANDVNVDEVNVVPATGESGDVLFLEGELDCYIDFWASGAVPRVLNEREGEETVFRVGDTLDIYGHTMAVNNTFLEENPDAVRGFLRAWAKGMQYVIENPDETVDRLLEEMPEQEREPLTWAVEKYAEYWDSEKANADGILTFEPDGFEATKEALVAADLMEDVDISGLYTFDYLPDPPLMP